MRKIFAWVLAGLLTAAQPSFAFPVVATCADAANTSTSITLTGIANQTWYIYGYQFSAGSATAAGSVNASITNLLTPAGGAVTTNVTVSAGTTVTVMLPVPIQTYQPGASVVATLPAVGTGSAHASCAIFAELR